MNVFITGISKGLGYALALEYARRGDSVFGVSRSAPMGLPAEIYHEQADITADEAKIAIEHMVSDVSHIDLLINNAGCGSTGFTAERVAVSELSFQLQLHCIGAFRVFQALLPKLRESSHPKVINITSRLGSISEHLAGTFEGREFSYPYRIAKCAQNMLTVCMAGDRSLSGMIVAAVNPGLLRTSSGSTDAERTAEDAAQEILPLIDSINAFGIYHPYREDVKL